MDDITMYGADWCSDTRRARAVMEAAGVAYRFVDTDQDPEGDATIGELQGGPRKIPTIVFADGSFVVEPSDAELRAKLRG